MPPYDFMRWSQRARERDAQASSVPVASFALVLLQSASRPLRMLRAARRWPRFQNGGPGSSRFVGHAEMRMEQRGVAEVDVRTMLERASGLEPNVVEGRYMIQTRQNGRPWIVIVEPGVDTKLLLSVIVYEVS